MISEIFLSSPQTIVTRNLKLETDIIDFYKRHPNVVQLLDKLKQEGGHFKLKGLAGSAKSVIATASIQQHRHNQIFVFNDKEYAAYFCNDLEKLLGESELESSRRSVLFYPTSYKRPYQPELVDNANVLMRSEVLHHLENRDTQTIVVTYPEAVTEKVVTQQYLERNLIKININEPVSLDSLIDLFQNNKFERVDFVTEAGQYAVRGGIVDVFSFAGDYPYRIELYGKQIESIRTFDPLTQLSVEKYTNITILPNIQNRVVVDKKVSIFAHFPKGSIVWIDDVESAIEKVAGEFDKAIAVFKTLEMAYLHKAPEELFLTGTAFSDILESFPIVEFGNRFSKTTADEFTFNMQPQPVFNKKFELLIENLLQHSDFGYQNFILSENPKQIQRLERVFFDLSKPEHRVQFVPVGLMLHEGFVDNDLKICCYTDHQIFQRYHKFSTHNQQKVRESITLKELYDLKPGDYVTHIDHGIGRFAGLEKIEINGHFQETIRLMYKENDILYLSIHSLHKISRYSGKDGAEPTLNRLGSNTWQNLKNKTKQRVKDIAKDLIKLYANRKSSKGFAFSGDTYLQTELEASFLYEDTPDQWKATQDAKADMESPMPMDRLICGDVGFGKTEVAIRAAFKAVADSKQVAVLVPTTILAFQHFKTFSERLEGMPCKVDYISRFRTAKEIKRIKQELQEGKIDILIGTHKIVGKDIIFKNLGLLIVDEEQKFGVTMKEKLKQLKINVDTLTLSATPIPRTLQFSLMGARDMSVIRTAPANRYPIQTELHVFSEEIVRDAILNELSRGGQVFFVHNRVQNILEIAGMIQRLIPDAKIAVGHGQMDGEKLEEVMLSFIEGEADILVATKIVENGLDIPNANTIIVNEAHTYGLSELHQLRGRVGRSNKRAFCYLFTPPDYMLTDEARKRLRAIEEFSEIGSGFNIAMRDLDIRGAGNILGAEQSGFISEIGMDMYQKILDEAIQELKQDEFKDLYEDAENTTNVTVADCVMETDLELMIPDDYVSNIAERLALYKKLDGLETDEALDKFKAELIDRFGPLPGDAVDLVKAVKLRRMAKQIGLEKIVLKRSRMIGTFVGNPDSSYYQGEQFGKVLQFIQQDPKACQMREHNGKLIISFENIKSIADAMIVFNMLV